MQSLWKPVVGFEGLYEVSSEGEVRSVDRWLTTRRGARIFRKGVSMTPRIGKSGYLYINLYRDSLSFTKKVHRLVAEAFCPNPRGAVQVNHVDGQKLNNLAENLEWVTASENTRHAVANGLNAPQSGELSHRSSIKNSDVDKIRAKILEGVPLEEVARTFGVTRAVVSGIKSGRRWAEIGEPSLRDACINSRFRVKNHPRTKLSSEDVLRIIDLLSSHVTTRRIARMFGVGAMTITNINTGSTWSHIRPTDGSSPPYNKRFKNKRL